MWLRDLLPQALPNIRVMTYGYNASFKNFSGHQDLSQIAGKMLAELVDLRKTEAVRVQQAAQSRFITDLPLLTLVEGKAPANCVRLP